MLKHYYNNIVRSCLLSKYNYINNNDMLNFKSCVITISFANENIEEDMRILYASFLLELLGCKRSYLKNISYVYRAKTKSLVLIITLVLRDYYVFNYIQLLVSVILPNFKLRYLKRNLKFDSWSFAYSFAFKDMNVVPMLPEVYYKWTFVLNSSFVLKNIKSYTLSNEVNDFFNFFYLTMDLFFKDQEDEEEQELVSVPTDQSAVVLGQPLVTASKVLL